MNSTPLLFTLPTELLLLIFTHLHPTRGFLVGEEEPQRRGENASRVKGLHSLSLTSRKVNAIVTPHLYTSIITTEANRKTLSKILHTFDENPDLAQHVAYIEQQISELEINLAETRDGRAFFPAGTWPLLWRTLGRASWGPLVDTSLFSLPPVKLPNLWSAHVNTTYPHRVNRSWELGHRFTVGLEALLAVATHVVDIALVTPSEETANMLSLRSWLPSHSQRRLWMSGSCEWSAVDAFFASPEGYTGSGYEAGDEVYECTWPFPHLYDYEGGGEGIRFQASMTEIVLGNCNASPPSIEQFVARCRDLKRFTCRWGSAIAARASRKQSIVDLEALGACLGEHAGSLEALVLDTIGYAASPANVTYEDLRKPVVAMGNLSHMAALRYLEVTPLVLWGSEGPDSEFSLSGVVPGGLEVLVIKCEARDQGVVFRELGRWAADGGFEGGFAQLRVVECVVVFENETEPVSVVGGKRGVGEGCTCAPVYDEEALGVVDVFRVAGVEMRVRGESGVSCRECRERRMGYW